MADRPLTARQRRALAMLPAVYRWTQGSMPSLARRGLVTRASRTVHGRRVLSWQLTAAGTAARAQARQEAHRA